MSGNKAVAVVGGDGGRAMPPLTGWEVRRYSSGRYGGHGPINKLIAAIERGSVALVVLLTRWMGHSESDRIRRACRAAGVRCLLAPGGSSSVGRLLATAPAGV